MFSLKWENVTPDTELRLDTAEVVDGTLPEEGGNEWGLASLLAHIAGTQLRATLPHTTVEIEGAVESEDSDVTGYAHVRVS